MNILNLNYLWCIAICLLFHLSLFSQNTEIIPGDRQPYLPETLIRNYFIGEGVEILDIKFEGSPKATGFFNNGTKDLGLESGIILGTGNVDKIEGPSSSESSTSTSNLEVRDTQLEAINGDNLLKDVISYEITFKPSADSIQFNYVFASEEYPEYVCSQFNDIFGFFISGPNPAGGRYESQNIAIVPGTTDLPVSINNVNNGMAGSSGSDANCQASGSLDFSNLFNENTSANLIFDGILDPFVAAAKVIPCETYTIRLTIGDAIDFLKDSAVFLEGKSFSSNAFDVKAVTVSANGTITEGCAQATLQFEIPENAVNDQAITFDLIGSVQNGIDIEFIDPKVIISAGQSSSEIQIIPLEDNIEEGIEALGIVVSMGACNKDTIWVGIEDNLLTPPEEQGPLFLCNDPSASVDFTIPFEPQTPVIFRNQNDIRIEPIETQVFSTVKVENIFPSTLNQTDFIQVCIEELSHPWIGDLSIFLFGPDNQFIELSSENGGNGGNGTGQDFFLNACFTFDATQMISDQSIRPPYIGEFLPEGNWDDLFGSSSYKVNGNWRLMMIDNFAGSVGTLHSWSIHFGRSYDINYSWSPDIDISCTDCPNPTFSPSESRTYTLNIEDTNGCSLEYEVLVENGGDSVDSPILSCNNEETDALTVSWEAVTGAASYQIRIDGGEWIDLREQISYTESGLASGSSLFFEVQAISDCGESEIASTTCSLGQCELSLDILLAQDPDCDTPNSGSISIQANGGTEPYTYQFGDITNNDGLFENIIGGEYTILVSDAKDCQSQVIVPLTSKTAILIEAEVFNASCKEANGRIDLSVSGGTGELNLQWSSNYDGNLEALAPDTYILEVTDQDGCTAIEEFVVGESANFEVNFDIVQPLCPDEPTGSITIQLNDPTLVNDIIWSNGVFGNINEDLSPGTYTVQFVSTDGCDFTQSFEIESSSDLEVQSITGNVDCQGGSDGFAELSISGGTEPYTIEWSNGLDINQISALTAGTYSAIITDFNGCKLFDTITIAEPLPLSIDEVFVENLGCNTSTGTIELFPNGGTPPYMLSVNQGDLSETMVFENLGVGTYSFEIVDSSGCTINTTEPIVIEPVDDILLETIPNIELTLGESPNLQAWVANREMDQISLVWSANDTTALSCTECISPKFTGTQSMTVEVSASDSDGCISTKFITIFVDTSTEVFIPNAFSPNGDGINDRLIVYGKQASVLSIDEFNVYDRWGNQLTNLNGLTLNNESEGWDGKFRGKDVNNGVYIWKLNITYLDGSTEILAGEVTLIR